MAGREGDTGGEKRKSGEGGVAEGEQSETTLDTPLVAEEKDAKESSALNLMEHDAAPAQSPAHHGDTPDNSTKNLYAIAAGYLAFTLTDSAIRMVILLQLFLLGFGAFHLSIMLSFYELTSVATNLLGGIAGSKWGLKATLIAGLLLQIVGVGMLAGLRTSEWSTVGVIVFVTTSQALCGAAKDLVKVAGKSVTKLVKLTKKRGDDAAQSSLFKVVAWLTGSKNSVKGIGYFFGAALLQASYHISIYVILGLLVLTLAPAVLLVDANVGKSSDKTPLTLAAIFNKGPLINQLSLARLFLFASRDVWFEVVLPVYLRGVLTWSYFPTGFFLAAWVIVYGIIQASAPALLRPLKQFPVHGPGGPILARWSAVLAVVTVILAMGTSLIKADKTALVWSGWGGAGVVSDGGASGFVVAGLLIFAPPFAILSSLHSFLIVAYSGRDKVAQNVGFYYMANAAGRLLGCLASGIVYQYTGSARLDVCLWMSLVFVVVSGICSWPLGPVPES